MRLKCNVLVQCGSIGSGKSLVGSLAIGQKGENVQLLVSTTKHKTGHTYTLSNNVTKVFDRHVSEGKASVCLKHPHINILISKANPSELQIFCKLVRAAANGQPMPKLAKLQSTKSRHLEPVKTVLCVNERKNYPFSSGFPLSLLQLKAENCQLTKIDNRWFKLKNLQDLDLSKNALGQAKMEDMCLNGMENLKCLNLAENELDFLPEVFWVSLPMSLVKLQLSGNNLTTVSDALCRLKNLKFLAVDKNQLETLPINLGSRLCNLTCLNVSGNRLKFLPGSMRFLRFLQLDTTDNAAELTTPPSPEVLLAIRASWPRSVLAPLSEIALKYIGDYTVQNKIDKESFLSALPLPTKIINCITKMDDCSMCRSSCQPSAVFEVLNYFDLRNIAISAAATTVTTSAILKGFCCSESCAELFARFSV